MGKEEKNVFMDKENGLVKIVLNPRLYAQNVVLRASYRFLDDFDVVVGGDPLSELVVTIKVRRGAKSDADNLDCAVDDFFAELIHSSVEEMQARRYADTRNALIGAALKSMVPGVSKLADDVSSKGSLKEKVNGEKCECKG